MTRLSLAASRRTFLTTTAAGAASVWIPRPVNGYSPADIREMTDGERVEPGISKWDLDTPALCVDLDKMEANIAKMQAALTRNGVAARPHAKTHKCAAIAKLQMAAGAIGICTAKLGEAEALFAQGIDEDLHDDQQSVGEQDPPGDGAAEEEPGLHPGG